MVKNRVNKNECIVFEIIEGEGSILYNTQTKETHLLNVTATMLFELCDNDLEDIFDKFYSLFEDGNKDQIYKDFHETINLFIDKKIIKIH